MSGITARAAGANHYCTPLPAVSNSTLYFRLMPLRFAFWRRGLGTLERRIMDVMWRSAEDLSVRDVHAALQQDLAYTTVMTTLDRLYKKGFLSRARAGRAYRYVARLDRHQVAMELVSNLVDDIGEQDRSLLDELERYVRERRRALERKPC